MVHCPSTVNRALASLLLLALAWGCTPDAYRRSADLEVDTLLRDRQKQTVGYEPTVDVPATMPTTPPAQAYRKVPVTKIPPAQFSPMEFERVELPYGPLGPEAKWAGMRAWDEEMLSLPTAIERPTGLRLGPPAPGDRPLRMDLFSCLQYAVQHGRDYQNQMETLYLAALDVTLQRHLLSPRPFLQNTLTYSGGQADVSYKSALTAATSAGVRQKLPYGGEVVAQTLVQFVDALHGNASNGESASVALSGTIPLLRGAGMVNLEPLINSERQLVYQVRGFEDFRRSYAVRIASQYFTLLTQYQNVGNRQKNLQNLTLLTERTEALYAAGRLSFLDVQRSMQALLSAQNSLITADEAYQTAMDSFRLTLGMAVDQPMEIVAVELDVIVPQAESQEAIRLARQYRLDLQTARDNVEDAQRGVQNSANFLLPGLDLNGQAAVGNRPDSPASHLDARSLTYQAGVTLDWPVDRVAERNVYRRSLIELQQAQRSYDLLGDQIATDVKDDLRTIRSAELSLEIQRRGIDLAQRRVDFANELLRQGRTDAREVVDAQSSLLDAQDGYERARAQLQIRVLEYLRDTGTLRVDPKAGAIGQSMTR